MITGSVTHEEAVAQHFIEDPKLAQIMFQGAIEESDLNEARKIQRRINEAKSRAYWATLLSHAEETAHNSNNLEPIIALMTRALDILKAAVPAGA